MLRRWSKPTLGLVDSLGRIDSGEFVTVLVGHAWRSLSLGGIIFYSNNLGFIHYHHFESCQTTQYILVLLLICPVNFDSVYISFKKKLHTQVCASMSTTIRVVSCLGMAPCVVCLDPDHTASRTRW